jgi:uncharacterized protein YrrD
MLISHKQLKKISVETQSGQFLGYVIGFDLETDTGTIEKYFVKSKIILANLWENSIIINKAQIINFDDAKMVVEDAVVKVSKIRKLPQVEKLKGTEPAVTSEIEN